MEGDGVPQRRIVRVSPGRALVHVYTGDGKGKTTAACGQAVRAAGHGLRVAFFQFFKPPVSGELRVLRKLANVTVVCAFPIRPSSVRAPQFRAAFAACWRKMMRRVANGQFDLVVLDEILIAVRDGYLSDDEVIKLMASRPATTELILTGRGATVRIKKAADLVTEMRQVKHPFPAVKARKGIEY